MEEQFPKDVLPEPPETAKNPTPNPAAVLWIFFAMMATVITIGFFCLGQVGDAMKPGLAHYHQGNYAAAEADFRKFNENYYTENEPSGHYYLGLCLLHEGKFAEGRTEIRWTYDRTGGKGTIGLNRGAERMLKALKELPANPTAAQTQEWQLKYLTQHQGH